MFRDAVRGREKGDNIFQSIVHTCNVIYLKMRGAIRKYWAATGAELRSLRGHSLAVTAVGFSPDGAAVTGARWSGAQASCHSKHSSAAAVVDPG